MTKYTTGVYMVTLSQVLFCWTLTACGGGNDPVVLTGTIGDPNDPDEDPTVSWPDAEIQPTEGCPGIEDACVYGPNDPSTKKAWACDGYAEYDWNWLEGTTPNEFSFEGSFHPFDGKYSDVMACCSDEYTGCENAPGLIPQEQSCLMDCAFQLCKKFAIDFKKWADLELDLDQEGTESLAFFQYLTDNVAECQKAMLLRTDCATLTGNPLSPLCTLPGTFYSRWEPDTTLFESYDDFVFEGQCQIFDWELFPDNAMCNGVQANNADPFSETEPGVDQLYEFEVLDSLLGTLSARVDETPVEYDVEISDIKFRKQLACDVTAPCAFRLEQMRLIQDEIDLGPLSLRYIRGALFVTAEGTHSGNTATLPESSLQILVVGEVESTTYTLLDGLPFAWILHNVDPVEFYVTESPTSLAPLFGIDSLTLSTGFTFDPDAPSAMSLDSDRELYSFL